MSPELVDYVLSDLYSPLSKLDPNTRQELLESLDLEDFARLKELLQRGDEIDDFELPACKAGIA